MLGFGSRQLSAVQISAARDLGAEHAEARSPSADGQELWTAIVGQPREDYEFGSFGVLVDSYHAAYREFW
ncbi:hypothetical protein [Herbiconiux solani]|uniref:hypothetical protein n=1 Tax=Herbiconiux solani TaxID=661329 RepID=UPI0008266723|nr:hypothetical protein [Herbiconiux solani]